MKHLAARLPLVNDDDFKLYDEFPSPDYFILSWNRGYDPADYFASFFGEYYYNVTPNKLIILKPNSLPEYDLEKKVHDNTYRTRMNSMNLTRKLMDVQAGTIDFTHTWWMTWGLSLLWLPPVLASGFTYGTWIYVGMALYNMFVRARLVAKVMRKGVKKYFDEVARGIEGLNEAAVNYDEILDDRLIKLNTIMHYHTMQSGGKTPCYTEAKIKMRTSPFWKYYGYNSPYSEWFKQEVGTTFSSQKFDHLYGEAPEPKLISAGIDFWKKAKKRFLFTTGHEDECWPGALAQLQLLDKLTQSLTRDIEGIDEAELEKIYGARYLNGFTRFEDLDKAFMEVAKDPAVSVYHIHDTPAGAVKLYVIGNEDVAYGFIPCDDPLRHDFGCWTAVDNHCRERGWPVDSFYHFDIDTVNKYAPFDVAMELMAMDKKLNIARVSNVRWRDENGARGDWLRSIRLRRIEGAELWWRPWLLHDAHECQRGKMAEPFWGNNGIMSIDDFPIDGYTLAKIEEIYQDRLPYALSSNLSPLWRVKRLLKKNPYYQISKKALKSVKDHGYRIQGGEHQAYGEQASIWPMQLWPIDTARCIDGDLLRKGDVRVRTTWALERMGAIGLTTETSPSDLCERFGQVYWYKVGLVTQ